ncbi:unnamed protein product [Candidula unifasciata]|uniref:PHD finger protein 10 n=1 Tax=Candidula unifasciata TaxID=100452 RepID=A0A8S3YZU5_9EUPU|nr:unnamed protein product [Candidula unifasciata]
MSAACDSEDIRLRNTISIDDATKDSAASDSNLETPTPSRKQRRASRDGLGISLMEGLEAGERVFTAENLFEYQWPQDGGEWYLLQEQVSEYLKIKSFKRKYPDLLRRTCDKEEKDFLRDKGVVTETQSDLGLTALRSEEVYDLMMKDYNSKYKDYISHLQEKQKKVIREKHKEYSAQAKLDKTKIESYSKKAARSAAEFNNSLMRDRKEERRAYFDLQTYTIHYPKNKFKTMPSQYTKVGAYPVALIPGQYQENYKKYSAEELKYYPVKTSLKDPPKVVKYIQPPPSGVKLPATDKHKSIVVSDGEESGCSSKEDNGDEIGNIDNENEDKENETMQVEGSDIVSLVRLEKKNKVKRKYTKSSSPDRLKKVGKKMKDAEVEKEEEKVLQDSAEQGTSPDGKKMPAKIHGLEKCRICKMRSTKEERKAGKLVKCAECGKIGHMSCLDLTEELVAVIKTYPWQCMECKTCVECLDPYDEDKMMFCDRCDRGYHTFCIGLDALPTGHWECKSCEGLPPIENKPKLSLSQGTQPVRSKKVSKASAARSSLSVKSEPDIGEDESGSLKSEGQASTEITDKLLQDSSHSGGKETPGSEKEGKTNTAVRVQASGDRKGRKRSSLLLTPKSRKSKTPKPRLSKKDRIKKARQTRRLKAKEGARNGGEHKILKKRRSKKMEEREAKLLLENPEEIESASYTVEKGIDGKQAHLDEFREMVGEGVDDSFVSAYNKDDKNLDLIRSVSRSIRVQGNGSVDVELKDSLGISAVKLDEVAGKTALKEDNFTEAFSLLPAETAEILPYEAMDQTTTNLVCSEGSATTLSVYGELQDGYVSLSSAQQPQTVDQYQALTVTDVAYSATNEGFHSQLTDSQIQFHAVPQVTPSSLPVDLSELQLPVSESHLLLPHMPPLPVTLLQELPHSESQNIHYSEAPIDVPQENLCLEGGQLQTMLPSVTLASDQAALFSLPSADVDLQIQHIEDMPQVGQVLLDPPQSSFVCMDPSVDGLTLDHPAAETASSSTQFSLDSALKMDVDQENSEKTSSSSNENLTSL